MVCEFSLCLGNIQTGTGPDIKQNGIIPLTLAFQLNNLSAVYTLVVQLSIRDEADNQVNMIFDPALISLCFGSGQKAIWLLWVGVEITSPRARLEKMSRLNRQTPIKYVEYSINPLFKLQHVFIRVEITCPFNSLISLPLPIFGVWPI